MKRTTLVFTSIFAAALSLAALGIGASVDMPSTLMSPAVYEQLEDEIEADARLAMGQLPRAPSKPRGWSSRDKWGSDSIYQKLYLKMMRSRRSEMLSAVSPSIRGM